MAKAYRTAKGQTLDIGSLLLQNENTRAVGNMGVNARGDIINSEGRTIKGRNEQMQAQYSQVHKEQQLAKDEPIYKNQAEAEAAALMKPKVTKKERVNAVAPEQVKTNSTHAPTADPVVETQPAPAKKTASKPKASGLAGAIAKARSVEQEEELTARQQKQATEGVKRI